MASRDVYTVYKMLYPKPKPLLQYCHQLIRHGQLIYFSPNTNTTKPRYFFLFDTALLLTKRTGSKKYWLKIYIHLRHGVQLLDAGPNDTQFRLMVTVKGRGRPIIVYGKDLAHKNLWVKDIKHVLWAVQGKKGPDPSLDMPTSPKALPSSVSSPRQEKRKKMSEKEKDEERKRRIEREEQERNRRRQAHKKAGRDEDEDSFSEDEGVADNDDAEESDEEDLVNDEVEKDKSSKEVDGLSNKLDSLLFDPFATVPATAPTAAVPPGASTTTTTTTYTATSYYPAYATTPAGGYVAAGAPYTAYPAAPTNTPALAAQPGARASVNSIGGAPTQMPQKVMDVSQISGDDFNKIAARGFQTAAATSTPAASAVVPAAKPQPTTTYQTPTSFTAAPAAYPAATTTTVPAAAAGLVPAASAYPAYPAGYAVGAYPVAAVSVQPTAAQQQLLQQQQQQQLYYQQQLQLLQQQQQRLQQLQLQQQQLQQYQQAAAIGGVPAVTAPTAGGYPAATGTATAGGFAPAGDDSFFALLQRK